MLAFDLRLRRGDFQLSAQAELAAPANGIVGPSGAGKSTLLSILAGLIQPDSGWIRLDGQLLLDTAVRVQVPPWRRRIGILFQDGLLFPHMTVRRNLEFGYRRLTPAERSIDFDRVVGLLEIGSLLERRPTLLSGGERQRVALGRALLYSPRLLLLDEPLSSLDDRLKQQILPFLRRVRDELAVPMIYVSHSMAEIDYIANSVLQMRKGILLQPQPAQR
jgi:molybdate transport system ATP-binding protein